MINAAAVAVKPKKALKRRNEKIESAKYKMKNRKMGGLCYDKRYYKAEQV